MDHAVAFGVRNGSGRVSPWLRIQDARDDTGMIMADGQRSEAEWEGLLLVIEERPEHVQVFVYDSADCEVLYTAERMNTDAAKFAAVEFAASTRFGPSHDLKAEVVAAMLLWEPV